jgi:hypothetical protein
MPVVFDFEHDSGGICGGALLIVVEGGVDGAQVQPVNEVIKGMLERTWDELVLKADGQE